MIHINNIKVFFNPDLFSSSSINISDNKINIITGKSGSGKSTLLNIIGLIDTKSSYNYTVDGNVIDFEDLINFRKQYIGYVFQDHGIIENITIKDNFEVFYELVNQSYNEKQVNELCVKLGLDHLDLNTKVTKLSGGEKKRLAIALVLIKNPKILLFDEPTASLDKENSIKIVDIIQSLKKEGLYIIISTHNEELYDYDEYYKIIDGNIETLCNQEDKETELNIIKQPFNYSKYSLKMIQNYRLKTILLFLILTISLTLVLINYGKIKEDMHTMDQQLSAMSSKEIIVDNRKGVRGLGLPYMINSPLFTLDEIKQAQEIEGVEKVIPYHKFNHSSVVDYRFNKNGSLIGVDYYNLEYEGKVYNTLELFEDSLNNIDDHYVFAVCNEEDQLKTCLQVDKSVTKGIIIPSSIADMLGIKELNHTKIKVHKPIYIGMLDKGIKENKEIHNEKMIIDEYIEMEIKGIYQINNKMNYDSYSNNVIFYDYDYFLEESLQYINNEIFMDNVFKSLSENNAEREIYYRSRYNPNFESSTILVYASDRNKIESIEKSLTNLYESIDIRTKQGFAKELSDSMDQMVKNTIIQPVVIMLVSIVVFVLIEFNALKKRKNEFALLIANGLERVHIIAIYEAIYVILISMLSSILITALISKIYMDMMIVLLVVLITLLVCNYIIIRIFINKIDINQELKVK